MEFEEQVEVLQKVNPKMPRGLIEDLVGLYDQIDDNEYLEELNNCILSKENFDNFCQKYGIKPFELKPFEGEIKDSGEVYHFSSLEEQDEWLLKQGKLTQEEYEINQKEDKLLENQRLKEDYQFIDVKQLTELLNTY